ncbi:hypothetical protein H2200_008112 [Cladophialophora chaetospira]|uniref:Ribonuclease H1 N-terminal domain-containing protein n=1 Tax=Cladophialophora chaetospira TaxID=386627 RepID=A0AA38X552_9EURO|nr:hypothetical protein H2200_008112 [Cladophialophora chaetospira]
MGSLSRRKNKEYYAVIKGRVEGPTIFSSWGDAHPRVTGCYADHKAFLTIEEAREWVRRKGFCEPKEVLKDTAIDTTPERNSVAFYAIAYGRNPGIRRVCGKTGSLEEIEEFQGACHKRFKTEAQAQAFIEDWKESYAEVWRSEVKKALDRGLQPKDMKFGMENILKEPNEVRDIVDLGEQFRRQIGIDGN